METQVERAYAVNEVRQMAYQFADLYFAFCAALRDELGEDAALRIAQRVLYTRAAERAEGMIVRAEQAGIRRAPENISEVSDVPYLGWVPEWGRDHCPYGTAWNKRIEAHAWFRTFAALYCDVTDTTIAEVFTGDHSHRLHENVVLGDEHCRRTYFEDADVARGARTYQE